MNRDDIIRMAREAGMHKSFVCEKPDDCPDDDDCCHKLVPEGLHGRPEVIERFAALVAAAEREKWKWEELHTCHPHCDRPACVAVRRAREDEREACAQIAHDTYEGFGPHAKGVDYVKQSIMIRIRERGAPDTLTKLNKAAEDNGEAL